MFGFIVIRGMAKVSKDNDFFCVLAVSGLLDIGCKVRPMVLPDTYQDHDSPARQYEEAGLTARDIVATALQALGVEGKAAVRA